MTGALEHRLRFPHLEVNEDGAVFRHPGYTLTYCRGCGQPILHAWRIHPEPVCRSSGCPAETSAGKGEPGTSARH